VARELYEQALKYDPNSLNRATNLGVLQAKGRSEIGMNLGRTRCGMGRYDEARAEVMRVLQFNPDLGGAKTLVVGPSFGWSLRLRLDCVSCIQWACQGGELETACRLRCFQATYM
jgi:tetratricopeptide (TPR) repeat protein